MKPQEQTYSKSRRLKNQIKAVVTNPYNIIVLIAVDLLVYLIERSGMDIYTVSSVLFRLFRRLYQVRDIKLDMTPNMEQIVRSCFPTANELLTVSTYRNWLMKLFWRL